MATFKTDTVTLPNGAVVETGTVTHDGHEYAALGAVVDVASGRALVYVSDDGKRAQTWEGADLGPLTVTGYAHGFGGTRLTCYRAQIAGRTWHGRGQGPCMCLRLRARKGE